MTTIKEVARLAGVSSAAVSRYFNGGSLSEEKRERIRKVVEETEYTPNAAAHLMRTGHSGQLGVIVPHVHSDSLSQIMSGIISSMNEEGYMCILGYTGGAREQEIRLMEAMERGQMEGIILMGTGLHRRLKTAINSCGIPLVVTGQCYKGVTSVYHDDENAMRDLASRMLKKRSKVAYIGVDEEDTAVGVARKAGVELAFKEAGRPVEELIYGRSEFTLESGYEVMKQLLLEHPGIDGVLCATDLIAHGAMKALREAGKKIPKQVSVAGVGNHWADEASYPPLTTAGFYYRECGRTAVKLLVEMIRSVDKPEVKQVKLGYTIIERGSM